VPILLRHKSQAGFGFLEALVALVLFAGVGIVGIAWLQQSLATSIKMQQSLAQSHIRKLMLDIVTSNNVAERNTGTAQAGEYTVEWRAEPVDRAQSQMGYPQGVGLHRVQLFNVTVTARHNQNTQEVLRETLQQLGHSPISRAQQLQESEQSEQQLQQLPRFLR
jgi:type II secretory pathway component PulJ